MPASTTPFSRPIAEIIASRFSCRSYDERPIAESTRQQLAGFLLSAAPAPFGSQVRLDLVAATEQDPKELRGLRTYGFIKNAAGFIVSAVQRSSKDMEDLGYLMERAILFATDMGLGTCWLGGTFRKSRFAERIALGGRETLPAVASVGYAAARPRALDRLIRRTAGSSRRLSWERLFFDGVFEQSLSPEAAGAYAEPIEMVRLAPSASNQQPWRVLRHGHAWHFYLRRTPGYGQWRFARRLRLADLQRVDIGIAMSHFELAARELGLAGSWALADPEIPLQGEPMEYVTTWVPE